MSEPIIIAIDHGYANMKTRNFVFPSGLVTYDHEPYSMERVLEYGGKYYVIGSGRQPLQRDKTGSENYYLLTLASIAMELEYLTDQQNCKGLWLEPFLNHLVVGDAHQSTASLSV